jgi:hypothetical protein
MRTNHYGRFGTTRQTIGNYIVRFNPWILRKKINFRNIKRMRNESESESERNENVQKTRVVALNSKTTRAPRFRVSKSTNPWSCDINTTSTKQREMSRLSQRVRLEHEINTNKWMWEFEWKRKRERGEERKSGVVVFSLLKCWVRVWNLLGIVMLDKP